MKVAELKELGYQEALAVIGAQGCRIGRDTHNDFVLAHGSVSAQHAVIDVLDGVMRIRDLGSRMGTFVNGKRIRDVPHRLFEGDRLNFGALHRTFVFFTFLSDYHSHHYQQQIFLDAGNHRAGMLAPTSCDYKQDIYGANAVLKVDVGVQAELKSIYDDILSSLRYGNASSALELALRLRDSDTANQLCYDLSELYSGLTRYYDSQTALGLKLYVYDEIGRKIMRYKFDFSRPTEFCYQLTYKLSNTSDDRDVIVELQQAIDSLKMENQLIGREIAGYKVDQLCELISAAELLAIGPYNPVSAGIVRQSCVYPLDVHVY